MRPETEKLLIDALEAGRAVHSFVAEKSLADDRSDLMLRAAVERQLFILGEAMTQLRSVDPVVSGAVTDAKRIVGFRNLLAHGYGQVDHARAWDIVENELPPTIREIERLIMGA